MLKNVSLNKCFSGYGEGDQPRHRYDDETSYGVGHGMEDAQGCFDGSGDGCGSSDGHGNTSGGGPGSGHADGLGHADGSGGEGTCRYGSGCLGGYGFG